MRSMGNLIVGLLCLCALPAMVCADAPATQPVDSAAAKAVRQRLLEWDKTAATIPLDQVRKYYHTTNEREAMYMDRIAHENWEECKTEQAVRAKWGADAQGKFAHLFNDSTLEDDQASTIKVDGDHATVSWDIKDFTPLPMIKIDRQWFVDGHVLFEDAIKDDPKMESNYGSNLKLLRQARKDISDEKFDDADSFIADYKYKLEHPADGN